MKQQQQRQQFGKLTKILLFFEKTAREILPDVDRPDNSSRLTGRSRFGSFFPLSW